MPPTRQTSDGLDKHKLDAQQKCRHDNEEGEWGVLERVDDGDATTLARTPADEGREADDTSRSMASRRTRDEWGRSEKRVRRVGERELTTRKGCKTTSASSNAMTKLRLSPNVTAPRPLAFQFGAL